MCAFDNNPTEEAYTLTVEGGEITCYPARKGEALVGTAISTVTNKGFGGNIKLMVGLLPDGSIHDIAVLER